MTDGAACARIFVLMLNFYMHHTPKEYVLPRLVTTLEFLADQDKKCSPYGLLYEEVAMDTDKLLRGESPLYCKKPLP